MVAVKCKCKCIVMGQYSHDRCKYEKCLAIHKFSEKDLPPTYKTARLADA
jgi:hypothetical protein